MRDKVDDVLSGYAFGTGVKSNSGRVARQSLPGEHPCSVGYRTTIASPNDGSSDKLPGVKVTEETTQHTGRNAWTAPDTRKGWALDLSDATFSGSLRERVEAEALASGQDAPNAGE